MSQFYQLRCEAAMYGNAMFIRITSTKYLCYRCPCSRYWHFTKISFWSNAISPVAISATFCPAESPGGAGGLSYTAARGILLQLTRLSPAVPRALVNQSGIGMPCVRISVHRHTIPRRGAKKIGRRAIPVIREAESPCGADPRRVNCNTWLKIN